MKATKAAGNFGGRLSTSAPQVLGTSLKVDGITWNPVDPARARYFVQKAREVRASVIV